MKDPKPLVNMQRPGKAELEDDGATREEEGRHAEGWCDRQRCQG